MTPRETMRLRLRKAGGAVAAAVVAAWCLLGVTPGPAAGQGVMRQDGVPGGASTTGVAGFPTIGETAGIDPFVPPSVVPEVLPGGLVTPAGFDAPFAGASVGVDPAAAPLTLPAALDPEAALSPGGLAGTLKIVGLLTVLSLAPAAFLMTTCFVRFIIVFGLLKQAIGAQQLPPNQVVVSLCLFLTAAVMGPVWGRCYEEGIRPYTDPAPGEVPPSLEEAFEKAAAPLRAFMADQIERGGNGRAVRLLLEYRRPPGVPPEEYAMPATYDEVPLGVLIPAYMLSELKVAFAIGFQIYLPFLVIDLVVSAVLISLGMMMLPPVLVSMPFKLLLFVLIDGWFLTVGMLVAGVRGG